MFHNMCTKQEIREALEDVLNDPDDHGETFLGREIGTYITTKGNDIITKLTLRFTVALISLTLAAAGTYYTLVNRVLALEITTVDNALEIDKGGRYTREDALIKDSEIQRQILDLKESDSQLRLDQIEATNNVRSDIRELRGLILSQ